MGVEGTGMGVEGRFVKSGPKVWEPVFWTNRLFTDWSP